MTQDELKLVLEALYPIAHNTTDDPRGQAYKAITAIKEALTQTERDYERGFIDGMQKQMQSSVDKAVNRMAQTQEPVGDDWTPCMKLPVVVYVRKQRLGESHVSTREGITPVKPDDLIMRGVSGEEYPIGRAIFEQTYSLNTAPPQPEQEPIAFYNPQQGGFYWAKPTTISCPQTVDVTPLAFYIKSPQRTWVGLTAEEVEKIWQSVEASDFHDCVLPFAKAIENKLKDKNNA